MKETIYNRLVRDKIGEKKIKNGETPYLRVLTDKEYEEKLNQKLQEELAEWLQDEEISELVDMVEVIYAILKHNNVSLEEFEKLRQEKLNKLGAFDEKLLLEKVLEK